jgi:hypothetical protein
MWDVTALRYDHPFGPRYVANGLLGESIEVTESGGAFRLGILPDWHHVILCTDDQQRRRSDQVVLMTHRLLVDHFEGERRSAGPAWRLQAQGDAEAAAFISN